MPYPEPYRFAALLLILGLWLPAPARALPEDRLAPVEIEADSAEIDQAHHLTRYRGHVKITQGSMELEADEVVVKYQGHEAETITATRFPSSINQVCLSCEFAHNRRWDRGSPHAQAACCSQRPPEPPRDDAPSPANLRTGRPSASL